MLAGLRLSREPPAPGQRDWMLLLLLAAALAGSAAGHMVFPSGRMLPMEIAPTSTRPAADPTTAGPVASGSTPVHADARTDAAPTPAPMPAEGSASVLDATGYVVARRQATVSAKTTGKVRDMLVEEGMAVAQGQVIARLDDSAEQARLDLTQAQLSAARAATQALDAELAHARRVLERANTLAGRDLLSAAELDDKRLQVEMLAARLERAHREVAVARAQVSVQRRQLQDFVIRAPFHGVVIDKAAQPGEMVSPVSAGGGYTRTGLGTIVDMESLEVEVDVNEAYISRVGAGQPARVILNAYPDDGYAAQVLAIVPAADRSRATVRVRVGFRELDARVLPEMGARVAFLNETHAQRSTRP